MQTLIMVGVMFAVFYFIVLRPQVKKQKETAAMLAALGKGDQVITRGGVIGTITGVQDDNQTLVLEIQDKVRIRVPRPYVEGKWEPKPAATAAKSAA
ncbi:MAG TPA: preprotein translocase subunit YajC [Kofleriaceae bacterium]